MPFRRLLAPLTLAAALAAPAVAHAGMFAGEVIDGPSADIVRVGEIDVARDGSGGVVYIKKEGGVDHVFLSRLFDGVFQPPERVDQGLAGEASSPVIAAGDGGRLSIAFISGDALYAVVRPAGAPGTPGPQAVGSPASAPSIDMSFHGAGYLTYTSGNDLRAARLERTEAAFKELGAVLDVDPSQAAADTAAKASDVTVSADGTGVVVWGESHPDGRTHVYGRRLYTTSISAAPQDLTLNDYQGRAAGSADTPDVEIEDDSSYAWAVYRQTIEGSPRAVARRLVGSQFEAPTVVDPLPWPSGEGVSSPGLSMDGQGVGLAATASAASNQVYAAPLEDDAFGKAATRIDGGTNVVDPRPRTGFAQNDDGFATWLQAAGPGEPVAARLRVFDNRTGFAAEQSATKLELGGIDAAAGYDAAASRGNDGVVVAIQGNAGERRLTAAMLDREPGAFVGLTTTKVRRFQGFSWGEAFNLWGPLKYTVLLNNQPVGETGERRLVPPAGVPDGVHRWRVVATDRRGQQSATPTRLVRVDNTAPPLTVRISGTRKAGKLLKFSFRTGDVQNPGASGLARIRVVWGDGNVGTVGPSKRAAHRYRRGRYNLRVSATDKAGNATVVRRRLTIKK